MAFVCRSFNRGIESDDASWNVSWSMRRTMRIGAALVVGCVFDRFIWTSIMGTI